MGNCADIQIISKIEMRNLIIVWVVLQLSVETSARARGWTTARGSGGSLPIPLWAIILIAVFGIIFLYAFFKTFCCCDDDDDDDENRTPTAGQLLVTLTMGKDSRQGEAKLEAQKLTSGNEDVQS